MKDFKQQLERFMLHVELTGGIELVSNRPKPLFDLSRNKLLEFVRRLEADEYTFQRYHGVSHLRAWKALALHHFFDPDMMDLGRRGRLRDLTQVAHALLPDSSRLLNFLNHVEFLLKDISCGKLICVNKTSDPLQSYITLEKFKTYAMDNRLRVHRQVPLKGDARPVIQSSLPRLIDDLSEGYKYWKTVEEGGSFTPGDYSTEPNLAPYFCALGYSAHHSQTMASLLRPGTAHVGRPPKQGLRQSPLPLEKPKEKGLKPF